MNSYDKSHKLGLGRCLLVDVDEGRVLDLHCDPVLVERIKEGREWSDGPLFGVGPERTDAVDVELHAVPVDGSYYSIWFPREALSAKISDLVAEMDP